MTAIVLDTSAVLAVLFEETGAEAVVDALDEAVVCSVNQVEIVSKLVDRGFAEADIRYRVASLNYEIRGFDAALGTRAGLLRAATRRFGLSLGDRACLALALQEGLPVLTADRSWAKLGLEVDVRIIR